MDDWITTLSTIIKVSKGKMTVKKFRMCAS